MVEYLSEDHLVHKLMTPNFLESKVLNDSIDTLSKPRFLIKKNETGVVINFERNQADSIRIFSKRSSEDTFELLAEISDLQYQDTRPNVFKAPELREYMASYIKNNMPIGQVSDIVLIIKK